jgi:Fe(3+) dicitrate transport protein
VTATFGRTLQVVALFCCLLVSRTTLGAEADAAAVEGGAAAVDIEPPGADGGADASAGPVEPIAAPLSPLPPAPLPPAAPPPAPAEPVVAPAEGPQRLEALTVVGTRESRTAGSAHVLRPRDLERMDYDNPESVAKHVPGVYARGEDGIGLRPNIGIRGTNPERSKKVTLMEDGILFAPAPYAAPAAYFFPLITRMELVRVIKGPGAVSFGPQTVGGAIDLVTRGIPGDETGAIDIAGGQYGYGKVHGYYGASTARSGYVLEGAHLRSTGFKELDGGGDTGFEKNEWMWKGRYLLSTDPDALQNLGLKLGYADEDSRESYLGLTDADLVANPNRRYRASGLDRMQWHRTQIAATYHARLRQAFTLDAAVYRNQFSRVWRKVNRMGNQTVTPDGRPTPGTTLPLVEVLASPSSPLRNAVAYSVLTGAEDSSGELDTIFIGPNQRQFVSQGVQAVGAWQGKTGPISHRVEAGLRFHYDRIDRLHTEDGFQMIGGNLVRDDNPTITTANGRAWVHALALHATVASSWGPLTLTPGLRVESIDSWVRDRLAGLEIRGATQQVVIPGIGVHAALTPSLGLLAGVYRGFSPAVPGQPGTVKPELSVNYEAGIRFTPRRLRLEAIGFFNDYQNLTSICAAAGGCPATQVDMQSEAGRAHIYGAELFGRADALVGRDFVIPLMVSYTYTRTEFLESFTSFDPTWGLVNAGDELPFVPRHQGSAVAAFETPRGSLAVAGAYVSSMRERAGPAGQPATPTEPLTDASFLLDVTARIWVTAAGHVYLSVRNVLDAHDIAARLPFGARPVAPRWIQVGTKWTF